jgi:allophanate hydrolase
LTLTLVNPISLDLVSLSRLYRDGSLSPRQIVRSLLERLGNRPESVVWTHLLPSSDLIAQAEVVEKRRSAGESLPLFGVPFAVKDVFDVAGYATTAVCPAFAYVPQRTAPVVDRLLKAGAILVGKTNLDQFSTGLAGDRSPYGACRNPFDREYISGGSSSGSAVAVAAGLVSFALGTDTAGSGRVPAGCTNIVGLKPTVGLLSTEGVVPAARSLDCVAILALTVGDALTVCEVAAGGRLPESTAALPAHPAGAEFVFATPRSGDLEFFGDEAQARGFRQGLAQLERMGGSRRDIDFAPFQEVAGLLYEGPWLAERLTNLDDFLHAHADEVYPVTRELLEGGTRFSAVDAFKAGYRLQELRATCLQVFERADVLIVPTMPCLPRLAAVQADSRGWSRRLGYYTNFVNLLGLAAVAVPSGFTPRGLPTGITLIGPANTERRLCVLASAWQRELKLPLGATRQPLPLPDQSVPSPTSSVPVPPDHVRVAVAGAHLRGQPLHPDLVGWGARFVRTARTARRYRFLALMDLRPPRPGLLRDDQRAAVVDLEIYDMPAAGFGRLVASVAPPLAIGTVELADGEMVKGFLCESFAAAGARDITDFGGWLAFREHLGRGSSVSANAGGTVNLSNSLNVEKELS